MVSGSSNIAPLPLAGQSLAPAFNLGVLLWPELDQPVHSLPSPVTKWAMLARATGPAVPLFCELIWRTRPPDILGNT